MIFALLWLYGAKGFVLYKGMKIIKIGTRGSPLALKQVEMVKAALAQKCPDIQTQTVVIKTSGDWDPAQGEVRLSEKEGGKGQFAKEIEAALLAGEIDCAVHSMKDMDSHMPKGLILEHMLERDDSRDVLLVSKSAKIGQKKRLDILPEGAVIGTASVRRQAFLLARRPDLKIVPMRGNVQTRIDKLRKEQKVDATLLALAGLKRLGLEDEADVILDPEEMLPAAGQGAVGIELREKDSDILAIFSQISHGETVLRVLAERAALAVLGGSCHTPIGAHAMLQGDHMHLRLQITALDGSQSYTEEGVYVVRNNEEARAFGRQLGHILKDKVPARFLDQHIKGAP